MTWIGEGTLLGPYRVERKLGAGGMGAVWEAYHVRLEKRVALKTLHSDVAASPETVERFVREGKAASRIRHPHVVDVTDVGIEQGTPYLVMELLEGEPLSARIERSSALTITEIVDIALPVIDALAAAHEAGIVHRDLKPDNIFLTRTRTGDVHPVVLDFGISKLVGATHALTATSAMMGTPRYMSPEQARGARDVDSRSDQFSLGLVLSEMATGRASVDGESLLEIVHRISSGEFERISNVAPQLPAPFSAAVDRMLATNREHRFRSMRDVGAALLPLASHRSRALWQRAFDASSLELSPTLPVAPAAVVAQTPMTGEAHRPATRRGGRGPLLFSLSAGAALLVALGVTAALRLPWPQPSAPSAPITATPAPSAEAPAHVAPIAEAPADAPDHAADRAEPTAVVAAAAPASSGESAGSARTGTVPVGVTPRSDVPAEPARVQPSRHERRAERRTAAAAPVEPTPPPPVEAAEPEIPQTPSRAAVVEAIRPLLQEADDCWAGTHGTTAVRMTVAGSTGRVIAVRVTGPVAGTPVGTCIGDVARRAVFPPFRRATFLINYPFPY